MTGLPKLPGFSFTDPTKQRFHLSQTFNYVNGYKIARSDFSGIGRSELDVNSVNYFNRLEALHYDPSLTYGRTKSTAPKVFLPHYALYDQKCLTFKAFFKQAVFESPWEYFRVRQVNLIYFLEDDSLTVIEPKTENSGFDQGRLVRRGKIPKTSDGTNFTWKDLNVGKDICIYGIVYHTVECDKFTREYLASQGVEVGESEEMPPDPYTQDRKFKTNPTTHKTPAADDKVRRFLEYDGKILKFKALWDDDSEFGEKRPYEVYYFLSDDTVSVKEVMEDSEGRDPFPQLLRRTKLPKIWTQRPDNFPSIYLELSDNEVNEYYQPKDFRVGETIFILGRRMLLYDCDMFTRNYFKKVLNYEVAPAITVSKPKKEPIKIKMPPHLGIGSLEDSLESTLRIIPKVPKKDVIRQVTNANKYLRYILKFDVVHPEDEIRQFIMKYNLGDGTCSIFEPKIINSGIMGGKYLRATLLIKPGSDPVDPDYYTPVDFYIGAVITVFQQRFNIIGADLYTYRYMQRNSEKFPCEVIENMRNYMFNQGLLDVDLQEQVDEDHEQQKKATRDAIGREIEITTSEREKCIEAAQSGKGIDTPEGKAKMDKIVQEYEQSIKQRTPVPEHGIKPVNLDCAYNVHIGDVKPVVCTDLGDSEFTPKHIDTQEEALQKHYDAIMARHKDICATGQLPECDTPKPIGFDVPVVKAKHEPPKPLMVQPYELPYGACRIKSVRFAEGPERCERDAKDLCDHKTQKIPCNCTNYYQKCTNSN